MSVEMIFQALRSHIDPMERFIHAFANSLDAPRLLHTNGDRGFRYEAADVRHFCLVKAVRVVSALNASLELARNGYTQEIGTLMRTLAEFTTHIEFVLVQGASEKHQAEVAKYIQAYFADTRRDPAAAIKRAQVPQGIVHAAIGKTLDNFAEQDGDPGDRAPAAQLYSNIYRVYSNYVHGKYPEIMDLYGGRPGRFHMQGMRGTPKDGENLATLESSIITARNTFLYMIQNLNLGALVQADPILAKWYTDIFDQNQG